MTTATELLALQEVDLALDKATARLAEIEESLVESEELLAARQEVEEKRAGVAVLRRQQQESEQSVDEVRQKAKEVEGRLYGGAVRIAKELADLQADLKSLNVRVAKREDGLLAILVEMEDAESGLAASESACAAVEAEWAATQRRLRDEKARLEPEAERLEAERESQASRMDRSSLGLYQLLRERRAGRAVARVERGMCQGCQISLPMSVLQKARMGLDLVQCVSCERILLVS